MFRAPRPFPVWATLFTVMGVMILITLGVWQVERLAWKRDLIAALETEYAKDVSATPLTLEVLQSIRAKGDVARGMVQGRPDMQSAVLLRDKIWRLDMGDAMPVGAVGVEIIAPYHLDDGSVLLVNLGWVANDDLPAVLDFLPKRSASAVAGIARLFQLNPYVAAAVQPDPVSIGQAKGWQTLPVIVTAEQPVHPAIHPLAQKTYPNNNHLQYALFWLSMALVLVVIYLLRFWRTN